MSKFSKYLRATETNRRTPEIDMPSVFVQEDFFPNFNGSGRIYNIGVQIQKQTAISSSLYNSKEFGNIIREIVDASKRALIEEMFGEFRKPLYEAIYLIRASGNNQETEKAVQLLNDVLNSMFHE